MLLDTTSIVDDPREAVELFVRELRARPDGLSSREAERRLVAYGRNEIGRRGGVRWPRQLAKQFTHPLALLLWLAAALAFVGGTPVLGAAILAVIFPQRHVRIRAGAPGRAVRSTGRRAPAAGCGAQGQAADDGRCGHACPRRLPACSSEGDRISADGRLLEGAPSDVDLFDADRRESPPVLTASAELRDTTGPLIEARDLVFSGSSCVGGTRSVSALVVRAGIADGAGPDRCP